MRHVEELKLFDFKPVPALLDQYRSFCRSHKPADLDSVTFSGTGEPTLIANLGLILRQFHDIGPYPLTIITNGSLLWLSAVRDNLKDADLVIPSLDAATESAWRRVNRPHPDMSLTRYLDGTVEFCAGHPGKIWMEVLLVRGVNDHRADLRVLGEFLKTVRLDRIQVGTVDRPPARSRARPVPAARLARIGKFLHDLSGHPVDVISRYRDLRFESSPASPADASSDSLGGRILQSVRLRPQTASEIGRILSIPPARLRPTIRQLETSGRISRVRFGRRVFLKSSV